MASENSSYPMAPFQAQNLHNDAESKELIRKRKEEGLQKIKTFGLAQLCLAIILGAFGIATIVLASENIGFPVFNPFPLIVAILIFISGGLGFYAGRKGLEDSRHGEVASSTKRMIIGNFCISVVVVTFAILAVVFSFFAGAICAGADATARNQDNEEVDLSEHCEPNKKANAAVAFIDGVLCLLVFVWVILGLCMFCAYGQYFGIKNNQYGFRQRIAAVPANAIAFQNTGPRSAFGVVS